MDKRLKEIMDRKIEIRKALTEDKEIDLDAAEKELKDLETEEVQLRKRQEIATAINIGTVVADNIAKPDEKGQRAADIDKFDTVEYRNAFMQHVVSGVPIPAEYRASTTTADAGAIIPTTTLNKIIEKVSAHGMILPLVTRTSYKGGVTIPKATVKPVATFVAEGAGSTKQKKSLTPIVFAYHKLRCAVSTSFEMDNLSLSAFEATIVSNIAEAMTIALEKAIINGDGAGKPKGILTETGQTVEVDDKINYAKLVEAETALPLEYEAKAVWVMTKKTFGQFLGMVDSNKQPIARVNYGINSVPERSLLGRKVVLCNYIPSYDATKTEEVFAFLFDFSDYVVNTNYNMTFKKYEDNENEDQVMKAIMLVDGKTIDDGSLVKMQRAAATP